MLEHQFILRQHALLEIGKLLLILNLDRIEVVHELQSLQIERSSLLVLLQEDLFLIFKELVLDYVLLHQAVQRLHVFAGQRDLEVCPVPPRLLLRSPTAQPVQTDDVLLREVVVLHRAQQLDALFDVLRVDQSVLLQDLLDLRDAQDLLLEGGELGLGTVLGQWGRSVLLPGGEIVAQGKGGAIREVYHRLLLF
jgi:hypothetical protein